MSNPLEPKDLPKQEQEAKPGIRQMMPWFGPEEEQAVSNYMRSGGWLTEFDKTREFEDLISRYVGAKHCVVVSNGTVSLIVTMIALGLKPRDEVLVPDFTQVASGNSVIPTGAKPIIVDIDRNDLCMDLGLAQKKLNSNTKAVVAVSLNGRCPRINEFVEFARQHSLYLIEDAAQSLGSRVEGKHLGTFGDVGSFSFSTPKIISTGQGGALVTNNSHLDELFRKIKDFGRAESGVDKHVTLGYNFKFTDLQAVVGLEQMKKLPWRVKRKERMYEIYRELLQSIPQVKFIQTDTKETPPWFMDILCEKREGLIKYLSERGVGTRPFYPPLHTQMPFATRSQGEFPVSKEISGRGLWLPSSSFLTDDQIRFVCSEIRHYYAS